MIAGLPLKCGSQSKPIVLSSNGNISVMDSGTILLIVSLNGRLCVIAPLVPWTMKGYSPGIESPAASIVNSVDAVGLSVAGVNQLDTNDGRFCVDKVTSSEKSLILVISIPVFVWLAEHTLISEDFGGHPKIRCTGSYPDTGTGIAQNIIGFPIVFRITRIIYLNSLESVMQC